MKTMLMLMLMITIMIDYCAGAYGLHGCLHCQHKLFNMYPLASTAAFCKVMCCGILLHVSAASRGSKFADVPCHTMQPCSPLTTLLLTLLLKGDVIFVSFANVLRPDQTVKFVVLTIC